MDIISSATVSHNATVCQFRSQSKCLSNRAIRCLRRSVSKFQSKSRNRFLQKFPKRFARTVMDTAEGMVALVVLMVLADLLVDSTVGNLVDILAALAVGRVVLGGHDPNIFYHNHHTSQKLLSVPDSRLKELNLL